MICKIHLSEKQLPLWYLVLFPYLGKDGIRVNAVAPGIIETDMVKELDERIIQAMASQIPLQRIGQPEDIAHAMMYLASDMASFVNGAILSVDGGFVG